MWPVLFSFFWLSILGGLVFLLLRFLHPEWWRRRWVKRLVLGMPIAGALGVLAWALTLLAGYGRAWIPAAVVVAVVVIALLMLVGSLPFSGLLAALVRAFTPREADVPDAAADDGSTLSRRELLVTATAVVPAVALAAGATGVLSALADPLVREVRVPVAALPPALRGLRILHLTDMHLGTFMALPELERTLEAVEARGADLVVLTGDVSDDLSMLEPALRLVSGLRPRLGVYGSLGNHEYYRGLTENRRAFRRAGVPLLVDEAVRVQTGGASILIGGADDPAYMGRDMVSFMKATVDRATRERVSGDLSLLLSHRPDGFDAAAENGVDLTLSGHTHGGQAGFAERSLFEPVFPQWYIRGVYRRGQSTLYTSAGFGHWFPFRLNCPAEAPLLVLEAGESAPSERRG